MSLLLVHHEHNDSTYYIGDLEAGKKVAHSENYVREYRTSNGHYVVEFSRTEGGPADEWGCSTKGDPNEAWRYALGAAFGPIDEGYDEQGLMDLLCQYV